VPSCPLIKAETFSHPVGFLLQVHVFEHEP
jgi:hypothetical protein